MENDPRYAQVEWGRYGVAPERSPCKLPPCHVGTTPSPQQRILCADPAT
jgi:hypothetical protein